MRQPISVIRGTNQTINIKLQTGSGDKYVLQDGEVIRFGVKKNPDAKSYLLLKELSSAEFENDSYVLLLLPSDTERMAFGCYYYDVGLQSGTNYFNVIECSNFEVKHNITERKVGG